MTRNTSLSMGPVGWLILGTVILAGLFPIFALALVVCLAGASSRPGRVRHRTNRQHDHHYRTLKPD